MSTDNIAYEKRYWDWRAQYDTMFAPENRFPHQDEQFPLVDGYSVRSKAYFYNGDLHLNGSESELLDKAGKMCIRDRCRPPRSTTTIPWSPWAWVLTG